MRFSFQSAIFSCDWWLFEHPDTTDDVRAVAGSPWPADSTIADRLDPLQQVDELPEDRGRRRTGHTA